MTYERQGKVSRHYQENKGQDKVQKGKEMTEQKQIDITKVTDLELGELLAQQKDMLYQAAQAVNALLAEFERRKKLLEKQESDPKQ